MSETSVKQLAINPAFFQDIKEDREELHFIEQRIKYLISAPELFAGSQPEFRELTEIFRDQLAFHFALEEAYGYFEEAIEVAPRLHKQALQLREQHSELYEMSQELADAAAREPPLETEALADRARTMMTRLDAHESAELSLIQGALNVDEGGGD